MEWAPLESNPEVFTALAHTLGLHREYGFVDVWGLDEEALAFVPAGVKAVVLLRPSGGGVHENAAATLVDHSSVYHLRQIESLGNACGTVAIVHALSNNLGIVGTDGPMYKFTARTSNLSAQDRGLELAKDAGIHSAHAAHATQGQTSAAEDAHGSVQFHFVCLLTRDGHLYELDGMRPGPVDHGPGFQESCLLSDAARVLREDYLPRFAENALFSVMALTFHGE